MNILEFLMKDHDELRRKMERIGRLASAEDFERNFLSFASHYEIHEGVEEEILFPALAKLQQSGAESMEFDYQRDHTELWRRLVLLRGSLAAGSMRWTERRFREFERYMSAHLRCEEEILFPFLRERLSPEELEAMGRRVSAVSRRYWARSEAACR